MSGPHDPVDITDNEGAIVVSIDVLRGYRARALAKDRCQHKRVLIDEMEAWFTCRDCDAKVNPVQWVMRLTEDWRHFVDTAKSARHEQARLDLRRWAVCRCGERVYLVGRTEDEKKRQATREGIYEKALETISVLIPEAAGQYAAETARKALAEARTAGAALSRREGEG